jgi:citrate synthase
METKRRELRLQNMAEYNENKDMYNTMDPKTKQDLLSDNSDKYRSMDPQRKQELLHKLQRNYHDMDQALKTQYLHEMRNTYNSMKPEKKKYNWLTDVQEMQFIVSENSKTAYNVI